MSEGGEENFQKTFLQRTKLCGCPSWLISDLTWQRTSAAEQPTTSYTTRTHLHWRRPSASNEWPCPTQFNKASTNIAVMDTDESSKGINTKHSYMWSKNQNYKMRQVRMHCNSRPPDAASVHILLNYDAHAKF